MTRISFLSNAPDRLQTAAAWLAKAWGERKPVLVYAPDGDLAERLDRLLWTSPAIGFVPHCRTTESLADETPILIAATLDHPPHRGCLLNLAHEVPPDFASFEEVIEVVSMDDHDRLPARNRFRVYRDRGYAPENINVADGL